MCVMCFLSSNDELVFFKKTNLLEIEELHKYFFKKSEIHFLNSEWKENMILKESWGYNATHKSWIYAGRYSTQWSFHGR